jgi:aminopeptidase
MFFPRYLGYLNDINRTYLMYTPEITEFPEFSLERLLATCFSFVETETLEVCILIDLPDLSLMIGHKFLDEAGFPVQKYAHDIFLKSLKEGVSERLGLTGNDFFAFKSTGGSNLDPEDELTNFDGDTLTFTEDVCPKYDLILAITDFSLTAPLTAMAKEYGFRGATLHGVNEIILKSGLSVDYEKISAQAELLRSVLDKADAFELDFEALGINSTLRIECDRQTAQKSHGLCPPGKPDVANLPAGEVYFVPKGARGAFPFRFPDGTLARMNVSDGAIVEAILLRGNEELVADRNRKLEDDPATGIIGELGFGTQLLPFSGRDIQDEKIFGTCHIATGRSDHLGGHITPSLFNSKQNASHDDILYAPPKTPEITITQVRMYKDGKVSPILENFEPTPFLINEVKHGYPVEQFAHGVS